MIMAIVPHDQTETILESLISAGYTATVTDSRGGILRQAQHLLYIAVKEADLDTVLHILRQAHQRVLPVDRASSASITLNLPNAGLEPNRTTDIDASGFDKQVIFVWDLDHFEIH